MDAWVDGPAAIRMLFSEAALQGVSFTHPSKFLPLLEQNKMAACLSTARIRAVDLGDHSTEPRLLSGA